MTELKHNIKIKFFTILSIIFICELLIMFLVPLEALGSNFLIGLADASILASVVSPLLYKFIVNDLYNKNLKLITILEEEKKYLDEFALVSYTDIEGRITYANKRFCKVSGYTLEELLKNTHRTVNSGYHPKEFWKNCWDTLSLGETWSARVKNKTKDGSFYWVDAKLFPRFDKNGKIIGYAAIRRDATLEVKHEEELVNLSRSKMAAAMAITLGHEINNPLAIAKGNLDYINKHQFDESKFEKIEHSLERITSIVKSIQELDSDKIQFTEYADHRKMVNIQNNDKKKPH